MSSRGSGGVRSCHWLLLAATSLACSGSINGSPGGTGTGSGGDGGDDSGGGNQAGQAGSASGGAPGEELNCPTEVSPVAAISPRLLERQFRNALADLFPFPINLDVAYPAAADAVFSTDAGINEVLRADAEAFVELGDRIALQAVDKLAQLLPCAAQANLACAESFVDAFVTRAFRRPLSAGERARFVALYQAARTGGDALTFPLAIGALVSATLQSPQFLYRLELGEASGGSPVRKLTPFETASRLSFLFWDAPPDAPLLEKARQGLLQDPDALFAEAERLLADPRGHAIMTHFLSEWLGHAGKTFPQHANATLADAFAEESRRFLEFTAFESAGTIPELLDNDATFVNRALAAHYGLPTEGLSDSAWKKVSLPQELAAGILSKAQFNASHSGTAGTSIVRRGHFVLDRLTCFDLGSPPADALDKEPVLPANATARERSQARMDISPCGGCHLHIDAAGFGLEDLDQVGRHRTTYPSGQPVDSAGQLALPGGEPLEFNGAAALARSLAGTGEFSSCVTRQWFRYATGLHEEGPAGDCHIDRMKRRTQAGGLRSLFASIVWSDALVYRTGNSAP